MPDGLEFDASSLHDLGRQLREAALRVRKEMEATLLIVAKEIATEAEKIAGDSGSQQIPPSIKVVPAPGTGTALVRAGTTADPIASLWELGNKGSKRSAKTFRHPVFGNRNVWVEQDKHPFLAPARRASLVTTRPQMKKAWDRALAPYGIRIRW